MEHYRVAILRSEGRQWQFLVPIEMDETAWKMRVIRIVRSLTRIPPDHDPEDLIGNPEICGWVAKELVEEFPVIETIVAEYPADKHDGIIDSDRGRLARELQRGLLEIIIEHNDLLIRRESADWVKLVRRPRPPPK